MSPSAIELAKHYCLDDVASASTIGTRLSSILAAIAAGQQLTAASKSFLVDRGLVSLVSLADGQIGKEQFDQLAAVERETRSDAARAHQQLRERQRDVDQAAAAAREAAMWAGLEAERTKRENDPRFIATRRNRALWLEYGLEGFIEEPAFSHLKAILRNIEAGTRLSEEDAVWLNSEGRDYATAEILRAYNRLEADFFVSEYDRTGDPWQAVSASGHLRKCNASDKAHELLATIPQHRLEQAKLRAAVCTTHGGAMRDLGQHHDALNLGEQAHALQPADRRPCTLMGAINIELGHIDIGHDWYRKAEERGATMNSIESQIRSLLAKMSADKREEISRRLLKIDPARYHWLQKA